MHLCFNIITFRMFCYSEAPKWDRIVDFYSHISYTCTGKGFICLMCFTIVQPVISSSGGLGFDLEVWIDNCYSVIFVMLYVTIVMSCVCTISSTSAAVSCKGLRASPRANLKIKHSYNHSCAEPCRASSASVESNYTAMC